MFIDSIEKAGISLRILALNEVKDNLELVMQAELGIEEWWNMIVKELEIIKKQNEIYNSIKL